MTDYTAKITALEEAAASGELRIKTDGREVEFRDMKSLLAALAYFQGKANASGIGGAVNYATTLYSEGDA